MSPTPRALTLLLNLGHAFDHLALLIFATAVAAIARAVHRAGGVGAADLAGQGCLSWIPHPS